MVFLLRHRINTGLMWIKCCSVVLNAYVDYYYTQKIYLNTTPIARWVSAAKEKKIFLLQVHKFKTAQYSLKSLRSGRSAIAYSAALVNFSSRSRHPASRSWASAAVWLRNMAKPSTVTDHKSRLSSCSIPCLWIKHMLHPVEADFRVGITGFGTCKVALGEWSTNCGMWQPARWRRTIDALSLQYVDHPALPIDRLQSSWS